MHPVLTLLVASSIQLSDDAPRPVDFTQIFLTVTQAFETAHSTQAPEAMVLTVRDIPFYYRLLSPVPVPVGVPSITYDWRSPVFFDLP
jgi:hypothetical protein